MTYLEAINEVLARLRESSVTTIAQNSYAILISKFVNDAKRQVEDAWEWDAQNTSLTVTTSSGISTYTVTGSGMKQKMVSANITTSGRQCALRPVSMKWIQDMQQLTTSTNAPPMYYAWNGTDGTDSKVELYNTPNDTYTISFNMNVPQVALTAASDIIIAPSDAIVMGAYARALAERGEDGAMASSEAYGLFKGILADRIALESARNVDYSEWVVV